MNSVQVSRVRELSSNGRKEQGKQTHLRESLLPLLQITEEEEVVRAKTPHVRTHGILLTVSPLSPDGNAVGDALPVAGTARGQLGIESRGTILLNRI